MQQADRTLRHLTGYQLRRATSAAMPEVNKVLEEFGLRRSTYSSLVVVVANPGLNQGQLADALAIERPNLVRIVDQLEQPTPQGCELEERATRALERLDNLLREGLSEQDKEILHRILQIIERNAETIQERDVAEISTP